MALLEVVGEHGGRKRDGGHHHQEDEIYEQEGTIPTPCPVQDSVVVDPDDADGEEADHIGGVGRPLLEKRPKEAA